MKILDAKAAADKELEKLRKLPAWQVTKVKSKIEVIEKARKEGRTVHFATSMDLYHFKNSELEQKFQKYNGRVVLQGDVVKDDSGSHAVFKEQRSSVSQMTAAKSFGCYFQTSKMRWTSLRRNIRLHPSQNRRRSNNVQTSEV